MGDKLIMSKKECERKVVLTAYAERRYTLTEAAERMATSFIDKQNLFGDVISWKEMQGWYIKLEVILMPST